MARSLQHGMATLSAAVAPAARLGSSIPWRAYGTVLRETLWSKAGILAFGAVFFLYAGLYLYLSGMLRYRPNMSFAVPISFPLVHVNLDPPGDFQPFIVFLPTDDFILLANLTGVLVTVALSALVGINAALLVQHMRYLAGKQGIYNRGGGLTAVLLSSLVPNVMCCGGSPVLMGLLPAGVSTGLTALGSQYGLVMAGVIFLMLGTTWLMMRTVHRARMSACGCDVSDTNRGAVSWPEVAAVFSLGVAIIHFTAAPEHFEEWWGYGVFFLALGAFQGVYAVGLLVPNARTFRRPWYFMLGITGNLLAVGLYMITRTIGVPFFGPEAGEVEAIGLMDIISKSLELGIAALLAGLIFQHWSHRRRVKQTQ